MARKLISFLAKGRKQQTWPVVTLWPGRELAQGSHVFLETTQCLPVSPSLHLPVLNLLDVFLLNKKSPPKPKTMYFSLEHEPPPSSPELAETMIVQLDNHFINRCIMNRLTYPRYHRIIPRDEHSQRSKPSQTAPQTMETSWASRTRPERKHQSRHSKHAPPHWGLGAPAQLAEAPP